MDDLERIKRAAMRIARLAALKAPAVIIAQQVNLLVDRAEAFCATHGVSLVDQREQWAVVLAEARAQPPMSAKEQAELKAEEAAYGVASEKARLLAGYTDEDWWRLDHGYRFDLVMAQYEEPEEQTDAR